MPYDARPDEGVFWAVYDTAKNEPVVINGTVCNQMMMEDADDLADSLNWQEEEQASGRSDQQLY